MRIHSWFVAALVATLALAAAGCSLGPKTIPRDRLDYHEALANSWKTQTLLNIVRARYADPPVFLDVASVVNSYSWEAGASVGATFGPNIDQENNLGARGTYTERPTITYNPLTGEKFAKSMMTPLTPVSILSLIQVGYPVDAVFRLCVKSINGVFNQSGSYALRRPADPAFVPVLEALRRIQSSGAVGIRLEKRGSEEMAILVLRGAGRDSLEADQQFVAKALGTKGAEEYRLVFGLLPREGGEIAILTRSMLEVMTEIGSGIEVPAKEIEEQRVVPPPTFGDAAPTLPPLLNVHCTPERPTDAFAAAQYRGRWFWIDDRDVSSKRILGFVMLLFSLAETGGQPPLPVLTIPAG